MKFAVGRARIQGSPSSLARYRKRAAECRLAAERSPTLEERLLWSGLADHWMNLVVEVESKVEHWRALNAPARPLPVLVGDGEGFPAARDIAPLMVRPWPDQSVRVVRAG